jgi:hypothetical protein
VNDEQGEDMTDRELLEAAAKAAGLRHVEYDGIDYEGQSGLWLLDGSGRPDCFWNPLTDDGDALWLAVKLRMTIITLSDSIEVADYHSHVCGQEMTTDGSDPYTATRRAIVRAAAAMAKEQR